MAGAALERKLRQQQEAKRPLPSLKIETQRPDTDDNLSPPKEMRVRQAGSFQDKANSAAKPTVVHPTAGKE